MKPRTTCSHARSALSCRFADGAGLTVSSPFHIDGATKVAPVRAPAVGQHSETVLRDAGYSADEIAKLKALGVL